MNEKEIPLPWTCETSDRVKEIAEKTFAWGLLIGTPIFTYMAIFTDYLGFFSDGYWFYGVIAFFCWAMRITIWDDDGKIQHLKFKCKQQKTDAVK